MQRWELSSSTILCESNLFFWVALGENLEDDFTVSGLSPTLSALISSFNVVDVLNVYHLGRTLKRQDSVFWVRVLARADVIISVIFVISSSQVKSVNCRRLNVLVQFFGAWF